MSQSTTGAGPSGQSVTAASCTPEQRAQLDRAFEGICGAVAHPGSDCQKVLGRYGRLESFQRQCKRGVRVRCTQKGCGQFLRQLLTPDKGLIEIGLGGFDGGVACGGREKPMDGPAHTMAHEMAHAARLVSDMDAEKVAYACRTLQEPR